MIAKVVYIQVGGGLNATSLEDACKKFLSKDSPRDKIHFLIELPSGEQRWITIRDDDGETVAYGNFVGLPDFLEYVKGRVKSGKG